MEGVVKERGVLGNEAGRRGDGVGGVKLRLRGGVGSGGGDFFVERNRHRWRRERSIVRTHRLAAKSIDSILGHRLDIFAPAFSGITKACSSLNIPHIRRGAWSRPKPIPPGSGLEQIPGHAAVCDVNKVGSLRASRARVQRGCRSLQNAMINQSIALDASVDLGLAAGEWGTLSK